MKKILTYLKEEYEKYSIKDILIKTMSFLLKHSVIIYCLIALLVSIFALLFLIPYSFEMVHGLTNAPYLYIINLWWLILVCWLAKDWLFKMIKKHYKPLCDFFNYMPIRFKKFGKKYFDNGITGAIGIAGLSASLPEKILSGGYKVVAPESLLLYLYLIMFTYFTYTITLSLYFYGIKFAKKELNSLKFS